MLQIYSKGRAMPPEVGDHVIVTTVPIYSETLALSCLPEGQRTGKVIACRQGTIDRVCEVELDCLPEEGHRLPVREFPASFLRTV